MDATLKYTETVVDDGRFAAELARLSASEWLAKSSEMQKVITAQGPALSQGLITQDRFLKAVFAPILVMGRKANSIAQEVPSSMSSALVKLQKQRLEGMLTIWGGALRTCFIGSAMRMCRGEDRYISAIGAEKRAGLIKTLVADERLFQVFTLSFECYVHCTYVSVLMSNKKANSLHLFSSLYNLNCSHSTPTCLLGQPRVGQDIFTIVSVLQVVYAAHYSIGSWPNRLWENIEALAKMPQLGYVAHYIFYPSFPEQPPGCVKNSSVMQKNVSKFLRQYIRVSTNLPLARCSFMISCILLQVPTHQWNVSLKESLDLKSYLP